MSDSIHQDPRPLAPLAYQILISLAQDDNHGYGLIKDIRARTGSSISPGTGTVYLGLQRLEDEGLVVESSQHPGKGEDSRRRYYRVTRLGRSVAAAEAKRMLALAQLAADVKLIPSTQLAARGAGSAKAK